MGKRFFGLTLSALLFALCYSAEAQQTTIPKVGWLGLGLANTQQGQRELLWQELSKLGYVEGKNITVEYRYAENNLDRLPGLANELVRLKVALIHTGGPNAARAAKQATKTIPIVFNNVNDPVPTGLVESLARPGANITGFAVISGILAGKRLELLKESLPKVKRVAVLWDPRNAGSVEQWKAHHQPAKELGLQLYSMEVNAAEQLESAFDAAVKAGSDALEMTQSPIVTSRRKQVAELAAKHRLPAIYHHRGYDR
jgi:putative ABC transport system substrate-binding protein